MGRPGGVRLRASFLRPCGPLRFFICRPAGGDRFFSFSYFAPAGAVKRRKAALLALRPPQAAHGGLLFAHAKSNKSVLKGATPPLRIPQ